jgi:hypothetical protein
MPLVVIREAGHEERESPATAGSSPLADPFEPRARHA